MRHTKDTPLSQPPTNPSGPYLSPHDTARRFGISAKALRLYEARGLVRAERTAAGWRVYGPAQFARLQQVIALKSFGLTLARIQALLAGRTAGLDAFLALHEVLLQRQKDETERALRLVAQARARLAAEGHLTPDDLIDLTRSTAVTKPIDYDAIAAKHLSIDDQKTLQNNGFSRWDQPDADWPALHAEAVRLMEGHVAPETPEAMDLACRWMRKVFQATGGDPALTRKVREVARELHDTQPQPAQSTSSNAQMDYIGKAYGAAIAAGLMPKPEG